MTLTQPDSSGVLSALSGVTVAVYKRDTTEAVAVYRRRDGTTQGPAPEAGASGGPNPFVTGPSGSIEFWCEGPAELDVAFTDTEAPPRIPPRTMGWNCFPAATSAIPTSSLAQDAGLALGAMADDVIRQMIPIGQVIDWWRPQASVPLPDGFEICDGHTVAAGQHEFPGLETSAVPLPDLRNVFILGADPTKAHAAGAGQGNPATNAPGIAGKGGSNAAKDLSHGHAVPGVSHSHSVTPAAHAHAAGGLYAGAHGHAPGSIYANGHNRSGSMAGGGSEAVAYANSISNMGGGVTANTQAGCGGSSANGGNVAVSSGGPSVSLNSATSSTTWTNDPGSDLRPQFFGLLKLMKVRQA